MVVLALVALGFGFGFGVAVWFGIGGGGLFSVVCVDLVGCTAFGMMGGWLGSSFWGCVLDF